MKFKRLFAEGFDPYAPQKPIPNHHPITALTHEMLTSHFPKTDAFDATHRSPQQIHYIDAPGHATEEEAQQAIDHLHHMVTSVGWKKHRDVRNLQVPADPQRTSIYKHPDLPHHELYIERNGHPQTNGEYFIHAGMDMKP